MEAFLSIWIDGGSSTTYCSSSLDIPKNKCNFCIQNAKFFGLYQNSRRGMKTSFLSIPRYIFIMHSLINYHFWIGFWIWFKLHWHLRENQGSGSRHLPLMFPISSGYTAVCAFVNGKIFGFWLSCLSRVKQDFAEKMLCDTVGMVICSISHLVFVHVLTMCIKRLTIVSFSD